MDGTDLVWIRIKLVFELACGPGVVWSVPRTCVLGKIQPSLRDWSCSEPLPSTACWAKFNRPCGTDPGTL